MTELFTDNQATGKGGTFVVPPDSSEVIRLRQELRLDRCRMPPYAPQVLGINALINNPYFALFDEMGFGKTKQVIDAACWLFEAGQINRVIVACPAAVRSVWFDEELGELQKHAWDSINHHITEYHTKSRYWKRAGNTTHRAQLEWFITNYDFIRRDEHRNDLMKYVGLKTLLVVDESWAIKNHKAEQTKSILKIRAKSGYVWLLNGTPIANSPGDMYAQGGVMNKKILDCRTWFEFRARYAVLGGFQQKQIIAWRNLDDMSARLAPYVLRRLKKNYIDIPEKQKPVVVEFSLTPSTWKIYKEMRDEMVAWLDKQTVGIARQAVIKGMRLAQITSGFLGGLEDPGLELTEDFLVDDSEVSNDWMSCVPDWIPTKKEAQVEDYYLTNSGPLATPDIMSDKPVRYLPPQEIGREKLDAYLEFLERQLIADPKLKMLSWCRFRPELARLNAELEKEFAKKYGLTLAQIHGGQKKVDRAFALRILDPRFSPNNAVHVSGTPTSGGIGLNCTAARMSAYLSNDYSLKTRLQSEDRIHRPGQVHPCSYFDFIAVGPKGQKTIDHSIIKALRNKDNIAEWTTSKWVKVLTEDE